MGILFDSHAHAIWVWNGESIGPAFIQTGAYHSYLGKIYALMWDNQQFICWQWMLL